MQVNQVLELMKDEWDTLQWQVSKEPQPHEAHLLQLDITKAREELCWQPVWDLTETLKQTALWYRCFLLDGRQVSREQLADYIELASRKECVWAN